MPGGAGPLEYVEGHVSLRLTSVAAGSGNGIGAVAQPDDRAELPFKKGFKHREDEIFGVIVHGGGWHRCVGLSVEIDNIRPNSPAMPAVTAA